MGTVVKCCHDTRCPFQSLNINIQKEQRKHHEKHHLGLVSVFQKFRERYYNHHHHHH